MITALLWGITPIFDKLCVAKASPAAVMAVRFTTTFLCILPLYLIPSFRSQIFALDTRTTLYVVSAAVLSAILGIFLYYWAMTKMEATKVTPICATYPLVTFVLGILFLHEKMTWTKATGTILSVLGIIFLSL